MVTSLKYVTSIHMLFFFWDTARNSACLMFCVKEVGRSEGDGIDMRSEESRLPVSVEIQTISLICDMRHPRFLEETL